MCFSAHGNALSGSIQGHGGLSFVNRNSRSAMLRSARYRPARKTQGVSPALSATTAPSCSSRLNADCYDDVPRMPSARLQVIEGRLDSTWVAVQTIQVAVAQFQK